MASCYPGGESTGPGRRTVTENQVTALLPNKIFTWNYLIFLRAPQAPITGVAEPSSHSWPPRARPGLSHLEKLECTVITAMTKAPGCTVDLDGIIIR